jgi:hypothetical protein
MSFDKRKGMRMSAAQHRQRFGCIRFEASPRVLWLALTAAMIGSLGVAGGAYAALPDGRAYELVSPVEKNGISPYGVVAAQDGEAVDFQAIGAFAGATSGSLNLYRSARTNSDWQTTPLTPSPPSPLSALEQQVPLFSSPDLSQTIFTTPASYAPGDGDGGALDLYLRSSDGGLTWLSRGSQGGAAAKQVTFDGATPDAGSVVFSTGESLLAAATALEENLQFPEPEYLYDRVVASGQTNLVNVDSAGNPIGGLAKTTLTASTSPGARLIAVGSTAGFFVGRSITVGTGAAEEPTEVLQVLNATELEVGGGLFGTLLGSHATGEAVMQQGYGAVLGDGTDLATGPSPTTEYVPADATGTTTHAISRDGSKIFFESPPPSGAGESEPASFELEQVGLYMREDNSRTVQIANSKSLHYEGAAADGSLVFYTSGRQVNTGGGRLYEFNTTGQQIGQAPPMSSILVSNGLHGDDTPETTLTSEAAIGETTITVASTAGFTVGETIEFNVGAQTGIGEVAVIGSVQDATHLALTAPVTGYLHEGDPVGALVIGRQRAAAAVAISNDGSHVYFISDGVLAVNANSQGDVANVFEPNLYVYDTGSGVTSFIATVAEKDVVADGNPAGLLGEPDVKRPAVPTPDGRVLAFASAGNLTGQNPNEEFTEIYRYAVNGDSLMCVSCTPEGVAPTGNADFGETAGGTYDPPGLSSPISENGDRVFFDTPDSLVPEDRNTGASPNPLLGTASSTDVYEWENGHVYLISDGGADGPATLDGTTPSGDDVFFVTSATLVPQDSDGGYQNVFDARVGGGFPAPGAGAPSCVGSGCRAAFGPPPALATPGSTGLSGPGNLPAPPVVKAKPKPRAKAKAVKCRKGSVRRHLKGRSVCVKRNNRGGK